MFRLILRGSVCLALLACLVGCSGGGDADHPKTVSVTGTVTYNGSGVEGAMVTFSPAEAGGFGSIGTTDASGKFTLMSQWGAAGAVPGSYKVAISKTEVQGVEADVEEAQIDENAPPAQITEHLPAKYKSAQTSQLTAEVKADGENDFPFDLTD
ncbi:MAG TPA: carboxypeptidase-like regulatory domain-containing protein [Thermoguttaceae bacterium]|nr:carboxypeptidase-like regulatory domain-containing protein [Thermoguttaceae bacterium]